MLPSSLMIMMMWMGMKAQDEHWQWRWWRHRARRRAQGLSPLCSRGGSGSSRAAVQNPGNGNREQQRRHIHGGRGGGHREHSHVDTPFKNVSVSESSLLAGQKFEEYFDIHQPWSIPPFDHHQKVPRLRDTRSMSPARQNWYHYFQMDVSWKFLYLFCRLNHFNLITVWPKIKSKRQQDKKWKRQKVRKTCHKGPAALAPVFQCCQRLYAEPFLKVVHSDTWLTVVTQFWQRCAGGSLGPVNFSPSKITFKKK